MPLRYILKCNGCGAPLADSLPRCPYCGEKTTFEALGMHDGLRKGAGGQLIIEGGAQVVVGARAGEVRECPFCGASTPAENKRCAQCGAKLVLETLWLRKLVVQGGGQLQVFSGGQVHIGRPPADPELLAAAEAGDLASVRARVDAGAEIDGADEQGINALLAGLRAGHVEVVRWLLAMGANVDDGDQAKNTPLHYAAWNGLVVAIDALLAAGADARAKNDAGERPIDLATTRGLQAAVERLAHV